MMRKIILLVVTALPLLLKAQMTMNVQLPAAGMVQKDQLWNLVLINPNDNLQECNLKLTLQDTKSGQVVLTGSSGTFILGKGVKVISSRDIQPVQYNYTILDFSRNYIPLGSYVACYQLSKNGGKGFEPVAEECVTINVDPLSPPILNTPLHQSEVKTPYPQFTWMPPAPFDMFNNLTYDLMVVEQKNGQTANEAIQNNIPVYTAANLIQPFETYKSSFTALEKNKQYAWQVIARNGSSYAAKTEIWTFTLGNDSIKKETNNSSYVKMSNANTEIAVMQEGMLKLEYNNLCADNAAVVAVYRQQDKNNRNRKAIEFKISIRQGQNFIVVDLNTKMKPDEKQVYEAVIRNCRGELYTVKFVTTSNK